MDLVARAERIKSKLRKARSRNLRPFGAEQHEFRFLPVVSEPELQVFETRHGVELPDEYRVFLRVVGSGGAGPAYGLIPFERALWPELQPLPADFLATPFAFEVETLAREPASETGDEYDRRKLREVSGTLLLCHEGCGYMHFLVCSGPARGQVWLDGTVSDGPYSPMRVGFMDWYERWLDDAHAGRQDPWWSRAAPEVEANFQDTLKAMRPWWRHF
jgi:hypothetical protein